MKMMSLDQDEITGLKLQTVVCNGNIEKQMASTDAGIIKAKFYVSWYFYIGS